MKSEPLIDINYTLYSAIPISSFIYMTRTLMILRFYKAKENL